MGRRPVALAALAALTLVLPAASSARPAVPEAPATFDARYPTASSTVAGTTKLVSEVDGDAVVSGVQIFVAAGLDRESPKQSGIAALVTECLERTPVRGVPLRDAIAAAGGFLTVTVDGRSAHFYIEGRPDRLASLVALVGTAFANPDFSPPTLAGARAALGTRIAENEGNALPVAIAMFRQSYYANGAGLPALGTAASLAQLSSRDVSAFYRETYRRSAVTASVVGNGVPALDGALASLVAGLPDGPLAAVDDRAKPIPADAPRIVAHRDVGAPWVLIGFAAPAPESPDFGAMLVLQALLSDAFERTSTTTLGFVEKSVGAIYLYDSSPASLVVYVNGSLVDPSLALRELLVASRTLGQKPLGNAGLQHYKTVAEGQFLTDSVTLSDRSYLLGTLAGQGLGSDPINAALAALEATTSPDLERVAKTYLQRYIVALVLPRSAPHTAPAAERSKPASPSARP